MFVVLSTKKQKLQYLSSRSPKKKAIFCRRKKVQGTWNGWLLLYSGDHTNEGFRCHIGETATAGQLLFFSVGAMFACSCSHSIDTALRYSDQNTVS